jgi:anti-anti-sigma factor
VPTHRQNSKTLAPPGSIPVAPSFAVAIAGGGAEPLVVQVSGDFDIAARSAVGDAALGDGAVVDVDLAKTTFMDCSGYGVLVAVGQLLRDHNGCLTIRNPTGQPARLLQMIADVESGLERDDV